MSIFRERCKKENILMAKHKDLYYDLYVQNGMTSQSPKSDRNEREDADFMETVRERMSSPPKSFTYSQFRGGRTRLYGVVPGYTTTKCK
ncbi:MAG: hypothetical protein EZS28_019071 [Streblomastix strix]|uniref:Uncharacterized protein n=1 Tax=Streblomastix strix TaxID=222440 RepID=A0A5J4VSK1_9EUKA|nr:MAG: hypothetical protein EZS28_019071 [Streblomastix strix]